MLGPILLGVAIALAQAVAAEEGEGSMSVERFAVSRDDAIHECFPSLCRTRTGRLILAYRESDEHQPRQFTRLIARHSDDGGATWSERQVLVATSTDEPDTLFKYNCPKVQQLEDGRVLYLCDAFINDLSKPPAERFVSARIVFWFSEDDGASWSEPVQTSVNGVMPDEIVELNDGSWLLATHLQNASPHCLVQYVSRSSDGGATWEPAVVVAKREGYDFCEASILECGDGFLVCYMRENRGLGRPVYKCFSSDGGRTWDGPYETLMDCGYRPVAHFTRGGDILILYRHYPGQGVGMRNTFAYIESEQSAREKDRAAQRGNILPLDHDRHAHPDTGYTGWAELDDGEFLAVNYIRDDAPMAQIRGYRFSLSDF
ncbi:MAG: exo-alpha-sialidase [Candidatus Hydrogenedentes bacterium]|nr:exo-alpha-sialidase [Candidatus Hydrogenedentota bacterium]